MGHKDLLHFEEVPIKNEKIQLEKTEYIFEKNIKYIFLMCFEHYIRQMAAVVVNTMLETFQEVYHHSLH